MLLRAWLCVIVLACVAACSSSSSVTIGVRLVSDYRPGVEAARVKTELLIGQSIATSFVVLTRERVISAQESLSRGTDIASFIGAEAGQYMIRVSLIAPDQSQLVSRVYIVNVQASGTYTAHLTRDCANVFCPNAASGAEQQCFGGQCVDARCSSDDRTHCPNDFFCADDDECTGAAACESSACVEGLCIASQQPVGATCGDNMTCNDEGECIARIGDDAGIGDASVLDAMTDASLDATADADVLPDASQVLDFSLDIGALPDVGHMMEEPDADVVVLVDGATSSGPEASVPDATIAFDMSVPTDAAVVIDAAEVLDAIISLDAAPLTDASALLDMGPTSTNECELGTDTCSRNQHCEDTIESFACHDPIDVGTASTMSCVLFQGGFVKCWGNYTDVGYGDDRPNTPRVDAIDFGDDLRVTQWSVGQGGACVILQDDSLRCWGWNRPGPRVPIDLGMGNTPKSVTVGLSDACVILQDDSLHCWGFNDSGQLGYGDTVTRPEVPSNAVDFGIGRTVKWATMGQFTACALLDDDTFRCWGGNSFGQLGYPDTMVRRAPDSVPVSFASGQIASSYMGGNADVCVSFTNGEMSCWGGNSLGELSSGVASISGAGWLVCALLDDGDLWCWGRNNSNGAAGLGDAAEYGNPVRALDFGTGRTVVAASARSGAHACALLDDDTVRCWGSGAYGELGTGVLTDAYSPSVAVDLHGD